MSVQRYLELAGEERDAYLGSLEPSQLLRLGVELFNAAHYWHAHEAWEEVWLEAPAELRDFYQGLIQVTAAFVHLSRRRYSGCVRLLQAGIARLESYGPHCLGVDLQSLLADARCVLAAVQGLGERRLHEFDLNNLPRIRLEAAGG